VDGDFVAYGLQILVEFGGLRCGLHAFLGDEVVGQDLAEADFVGVGQGGSLRLSE
jgi:hypothetical protein